jgi:dihydrofolate synthase/folylpolyglutamate synthase
MGRKMKYIHIAGTNAKGSVSEYLYQILLAGGISCGVFTSPHLFSPCERMRMNGKEISGGDYEKYMRAAKGGDGEHLFRVWTRAALRWFADNNAEAAVIEAGIGGKKDSTNAVDSEVAVITPISLDHTRILGDTVEKIARDKCGIIKQGAVVITYGQEKSVMKIIQAVCRRKGAKLVTVGEYGIKDAGLNGQVFDYKGMKGLFISAVSPHQAENACAAIEAALALGIGEKAVRQGLQTAVLPARVQIAGPGLVVDGGHNPAAIEELKLEIGRAHV